MNWTQILADSGIPESPGRPKAAQMMTFEAVFKNHTEVIKAMSFRGALKKLKGRSKDLQMLCTADEQSES